MILRYVLFFWVFLVSVEPFDSFAFQQPISIDSRVRTYVYNPNEVFILRGNHAYQSYIEFLPNEVVKNYCNWRLGKLEY